MLDGARVHAVNVGGTKAVLAACKAAGVEALIYCSSYNAVFDGSR